MPKGGIRPICIMDGCKRPNHARNLCKYHYQKQPDQVEKHRILMQSPKAKKSHSKYQKSAIGRKVAIEASRKYRVSKKGRAFYEKRLWMIKNDPEHKQRTKKINRKKYLKYKQKLLEKNKLWRTKTERGKLHSKMRRFHLPMDAPHEVVVACELLSTLKKEIRHEHNKT